jgi:hypothetical protein
MLPPEQIRANYLQVLEQIGEAARGCGRNPQEVRLVVVTKGQPLKAIRAVCAAGATILGENYVEEATVKIEALRSEFDIEWHMIGHVQSRKAEAACANFVWVETVDSLRLAERLNRFAAAQSRRLPVLLEMNLAGEASKSGLPAADPAGWPELGLLVSQVCALPNLDVRGLMSVPPFFDDPEQARPYFGRLRRLAQQLAGLAGVPPLRELSMGMSADFTVAIQEGATIVRVGTAILGPRQSTAGG